MKIAHPWRRILVATILMTAGAVAGGGCSNSSGGATGSGGASGADSGGTTGAGSGGTPASGGSDGTAGRAASTGGAGPSGTGGRGTGTAGRGGTSSGGGRAGTGGAGTGGATVDAGSTPDVAGGGGAAGDGTSCTMGTWPTADPTVAGPFATVTENNVGPAVGAGADGGAPVAFTMFRPKDLSQMGLCHPVITWGNGTGSNPSLYKVLLNHLASHGFVVIASDSPNVAQGTPAPMVAGVTWVLEQNDDPSSALYHKIDTTHIGATGHSQGGFATTSAAGDSHITTIAPLCGASNQRNLHGPAMLFCGGMDTTVPCSTIQTTFNAISNQPVMLASYLSVDHGSWLTFRGTKPSVVEATVAAWMRVHLMNDTALRPWFYGASCKLCTDPAWQVMQKMMDQ